MPDTPEVPRWLSALLTEKFFNACLVHEDARKNEKNVFCFDCCHGVCPHCLLSDHRSHRHFQIRRYVYHDVMRLVHADKLMDCAQVQSYTTNNAKVVFLNQRAQTRPPRVSGSFCITCGRTLQESSLFCSISCKLQHILRNGGKLSCFLRSCEFLVLPEPGTEDAHALMTPDSVLELDGSMGSESGSSSCVPAVSMDCAAAATEVVRKKRSKVPCCSTGFRLSCRPVSGCMMNRRKGTPHRSPLY